MPKPASAAERGQPAASQGLDFDGLDGLLGYSVRRAQGAMHRDFVASMAELELTQKQAATVWLIAANGGVSQIDLATCLGMDRATMMSIIDRLEERGLVTRKRSKSDRRKQELYLTPLGQATLKKAKARIASHEQRFFARLKPSEVTALFSALQKISGE